MARHSPRHTSVTLRTLFAEIFFSPLLRERIDASRISLAGPSVCLYVDFGRRKVWTRTARSDGDSLLHKEYIVEEDLLHEGQVRLAAIDC